MGDGEKLLTHLNSALKVLLGLDIFPRVPKKKVKLAGTRNSKPEAFPLSSLLLLLLLLLLFVGAWGGVVIKALRY